MEIKDTINNIKSGYGSVKIRPGMYTEHTMIFLDGERMKEDMFTWRMTKDQYDISEYKTPYYLTLDDISGQFFTKRRKGILTVVVENATSGTIYQIGNHNQVVWEKHGVTNGYS